MSGNWGTGDEGLGEWGGGGIGSSSVSVSGAQATSERTVQVTLSGPVRAQSAQADGDALNPATWTVQRLDTEAYFVILAVRDVTGDAEVFELYTLEKFGAVTISHEITALDLLDAAGDSVVAPLSAEFLGCLAAPAARADRTPVDLRNLPSSGTALQGVLQATSAGDYATHGGTELLRKLILRRLTTAPGAFFHLDPKTYGLGLAAKEPLPTRDVGVLKVAIERQVQQEPEVDACSATVTIARTGIVTITLRVRLKSGQDVVLPYEIPATAGVAL